MNNLHKSWRESLAIFELKNLAISIAFCKGNFAKMQKVLAFLCLM